MHTGTETGEARPALLFSPGTSPTPSIVILDTGQDAEALVHHVQSGPTHDGHDDIPATTQHPVPPMRADVPKGAVWLRPAPVPIRTARLQAYLCDLQVTSVPRAGQRLAAFTSLQLHSPAMRGVVSGSSARAWALTMLSKLLPEAVHSQESHSAPPTNGNLKEHG